MLNMCCFGVRCGAMPCHQRGGEKQKQCEIKSRASDLDEHRPGRHGATRWRTNIGPAGIAKSFCILIMVILIVVLIITDVAIHIILNLTMLTQHSNTQLGVMPDLCRSVVLEYVRSEVRYYRRTQADMTCRNQAGDTQRAACDVHAFIVLICGMSWRD